MSLTVPKNEVTENAEVAATPEVAVNAIPIRPELLLGISSYQDPPSEDEEISLVDRFKGSCEVCGVALTSDMRHSHLHKKLWYNSCGMCYFAENLDGIPSFKKGSIIYFPHMSQARLNSVLRAIWSVESLNDIGDMNDEYNVMSATFDELNAMIEGQINITTSYFDFSDPDILSSLLNLLPPEDYEQRWKLLRSFRWLPDRSVFEDEMVYWAQKSFHHLHPEKINSNITTFMTNYVPAFNIRE